MSKTRIDNPHLGCRDTFIKENRKLVYMVVNKHFKGMAKWLNIPLDDLYSEGFIGLIKAYDAYDPSKVGGRLLKFSTYAVPCIFGGVRNHIRDKERAIRVPRAIYPILSQAVSLHKSGYSIEKIADALQCNEHTVVEALTYSKNQFPRALNEPLAQKDGSELAVSDFVGKEDDLSGVFVQELLSGLNRRERLAVELRAQGYDQREIGKRLGVSQVQVSRLLLKIKNLWEGIREGNGAPQKINKNQAAVAELRPKKVERRDSVKSRKATPEEMKKHNIQTIIDLADWFTDANLPDVPSIGINSHGISFNASAVEMMGLEKGMKLEIGFSLDHLSLVIRVSDKGAKLKRLNGQKSLAIVNKRLVDWLLARSVIQKRYSLEVDQLTRVWISKVELGTKESVS
ncbi:sigma-70 family RNA polymerase sigma factor [Brevibacillus laterosporus]|uniref:sigma-70 family RNA polymerase sigma factor n=1 Tax=Brevibacillus laterosporus TaxID=1465 RepID=UPI0013157A28|nr:sigma-70 family RNA polymerase sigma factor [Brevibacillus laterosporus]